MAPKRPKGAGAFPKAVESPAPPRPDPDALYAALDLGTNSCRMLIAQPKGSGFHVVDSFSKSVQLGAGLERTGRLSRSSMARTTCTAALPLMLITRSAVSSSRPSTTVRYWAAAPGRWKRWVICWLMMPIPGSTRFASNLYAFDEYSAN